MMLVLTMIVVLSITPAYQFPDYWSRLNLPAEHIPVFFRNNPGVRQLCLQDDSCPYKGLTEVRKCWGYEDGCPDDEKMKLPSCPGESRNWVKDKAAQIDKFWTDADFGYVKYFQKEEKTFCKPKQPGGAILNCSNYLRHCRARNIYINFKNSGFKNSKNRYREDIFSPGDIGGFCDVDEEALKKENQHKSPLQSWFAELGEYSSLSVDPFSSKNCDIIIDKPTYLIKLDAGINMFHHFCDFVNLYATNHLNNSFSTDVNIVMWDTSEMYYGDFFQETWRAFTDYPVVHLKEFDGKQVCFRDAVFSLLARMRLGLYYNMPLMPGCHGSSMMKAFSEHVLHRLGIKQDGPLKDKVRITLLDRKSMYRNIMNQKQLVEAMQKIVNIDIQVVVYNRDMSFLDQLRISHNSDIFIGMHGAGLTHMLFQPDWAVGFELYNCDDENCYRDLARLRGIEYFTWEDEDKVKAEDEGHHPTLGAHAKFTNYEFQVDEFMRLVMKATQYVQGHPQFRQARRSKYGKHIKTEL